MHVRVRLLGGFELDVDAVAVPADAWRSRRSRQLVALGTGVVGVVQVVDDEEATVVIDAHLCVAESYLYGGAPYEDVIAFATDLARRAGEAGAARTEAFAATLLGEAHLLRGDVPVATGHLHTAVARHRTVGVLCGGALTLQRLAEALLAAGDEDGARAALDQAFVAARGSPVGTRHLLDRIHGTAIRATRDASAAVDAVEEADRDLRGPLETCPPCSINLSVPAAIACAAAGEVERAAGYLARWRRGSSGCTAT